jgi:hypothetical protein
MGNHKAVERACVDRLLKVLGRPATRIDSAAPPAPDVRAMFVDGSVEVFEVTDIHPDEIPGQGSAARQDEERRATLDPSAIIPGWIPTEAMAAIRYRVEQKVKKASGYALEPDETLSLLLAGSLPKIGAVKSTFVFAPFLSVEQLNGELNELLAHSQFENAFIHLPLSGNAVHGWNRPCRWQVLRAAEDCSSEGRQMLALLKSEGGFGPDRLLPGTKIFGRLP